MKILRTLTLAAAGLILTIATPAFARTPQSCEFHIIVTNAFAARGHFASIGPGSTINGYLKPYEDIEALLREHLAPGIQSDIIQAADVPALLGLTGYQVIVEPTMEFRPFDTVAAMMADIRSGPRRSTSLTPCYAEIWVFSQMYEKTALSRMLYSWFSTRQFDGDKILFEHNTAKATQLDSFPPKSAEQADAARTDIRRAFRANLLRFTRSGKFKKLKR